jgi:hypothetical protein
VPELLVQGTHPKKPIASLHPYRKVRPILLLVLQLQFFSTCPPFHKGVYSLVRDVLLDTAELFPVTVPDTVPDTVPGTVGVGAGAGERAGAGAGAGVGADAGAGAGSGAGEGGVQGSEGENRGSEGGKSEGWVHLGGDEVDFRAFEREMLRARRGVGGSAPPPPPSWSSSSLSSPSPSSAEQTAESGEWPAGVSAEGAWAHFEREMQAAVNDTPGLRGRQVGR